MKKHGIFQFWIGCPSQITLTKHRPLQTAVTKHSLFDFVRTGHSNIGFHQYVLESGKQGPFKLLCLLI